MISDDLKFTETHEWVRVEEDSSTATIGLSAYAAEQLGDVVYLELPAVGDAVKQGLLTALDKIAEDPCGEGWMVKIKIENSDELRSLMDSTQYEEFLKTKED